jgi:hypothetical protein
VLSAVEAARASWSNKARKPHAARKKPKMAPYRVRMASLVLRHQTEASRPADPSRKINRAMPATWARTGARASSPQAALKQSRGRVMDSRAARVSTWASSLPSRISQERRSVVSRCPRVPRVLASVTSPATKAGVTSRISRNCSQASNSTCILLARTTRSAAGVRKGT